MNTDALKIRLIELLPEAIVEDGSEWLLVNITPALWRAAAIKLRFDEALFFDYLFCVTCVDWKTHLVMTYHLNSTKHRNSIVIKCQLDQVNPEIETVSDIWRTADFNEREAYEMFGVQFLNHPDLRLLILPDGWEGRNPMRKDFEDPINMIRL